MKTFKVILVPFVLLLATMTWSDYYYSKLERDYTMVSDSVSIVGVVTDFKIHWKHTYLKMNTGRQLHVQPWHSEDEWQPFHEVIATGDAIYKERDSDMIVVRKDGRDYRFIAN